MPVWQNVNLKQKAVFEIIQRENVSRLPYYLEGAELDFFLRGIAMGPHAKTYLPQLVERGKSPVYIARGYAPPQYSRCVRLRYYGPDPILKDAGPSWPSGTAGELLEYTIGWRWLYAYWDGPLVDEVEGGADTTWWPEVARPDWSWENLKIVRPPYYVPEDGRPWRCREEVGASDASAAYRPVTVRSKGKGKGGNTRLGDI